MKNKAILVIDMPENCAECFALDDNSDYPICIITGQQRGYTFRTREQKMDRCPLQPMPEKYDIPDSDFEYELGFNKCIDWILGGDKNESS